MGQEPAGSTSPPARGCGCGSSANAPAETHSKTAYIALGSNLGDRVAWIEEACREMDRRGIRVKRTSSLWETAPMYVLEQDSFVNGACEVETDLEPLPLLDALQDIERSLGRQKFIDKGPRNIDLDILLYDDQKINHERLIVPHIGIPEREFALRPLAELIPGKAIDPARPWKLTQDYLNELPNRELVSPLTPLSSQVRPLTPTHPHRKTHVMAILNVTPDSFSDGGVHTAETLAETVRGFLRSGATLIDVGGQSTRPGAPECTAEEETSRVLPAIELIRRIEAESMAITDPDGSAGEQRAQPVVISIDTYRAAVAEAAIAAGADLVNDISAGQLDPEMLPTIARLGKTVCLMHTRGDPQIMTKLTDYGPRGLVPTVAAELLERVSAAEAAGIRRWRIILDPGLGFAKTGAQNLDLLRRMDELRSWPGLEGLPWLLGSSRKGFIGKVTGVPKPAERVWGTAATVAAAVQGGADIVRVHDVPEMTMVVAMADAIWRR